MIVSDEYFPCIGVQEAETEFLGAIQMSRISSAWLFTGPQGIGKFNLALKLSRYLLTRHEEWRKTTQGPDVQLSDLVTPENHPINNRIRAGSEPSLRILQRSEDPNTGKTRSEISINDVRILHEFFALTAPDGQARVAIINPADDLNIHAANALLKLLEEPPSNSFLFLINHSLSHLLPTIISRCRKLRCSPLDTESFAQLLRGITGIPDDQKSGLAVISGGSLVKAYLYNELKALEQYRKILESIGSDQSSRSQLIENIVSRTDSDQSRAVFIMIMDLIFTLLGRLAKFQITIQRGPEVYKGEFSTFARLTQLNNSSVFWAGLYQELVDVRYWSLEADIDNFSVVNEFIGRIEATAIRCID